MRRGWRRMLIVLAALAVMGFGMVAVMNAQVSKLAQLDYAAAVPAQLQDGTYRGKVAALLVQAEVEVDVRAGHIQEVRLMRHQHGLGEGAEKIAGQMTVQGRIDVDTIAGATASSIVIKAAALDALQGE